MAVYLLGLGVFFALLGAFRRWANGFGQATPGGQDMALGLRLWPLFLYGGLALVVVGVVVELVR